MESNNEYWNKIKRNYKKLKNIKNIKNIKKY